MDSVPPEAPDSHATSEESSERSARWRLKRFAHWHWKIKIPTPILVTLVGITLSAWLLPAFTRQWDDRQKSQQLKAVLVTDMASATAEAVSSGGAGSGDPLNRQGRVTARRWWARSLEIDARLQAQFGNSVVTGWEIYSFVVSKWLGAPLPQLATQANTAFWSVNSAAFGPRFDRSSPIWQSALNALMSVDQTRPPYPRQNPIARTMRDVQRYMISELTRARGPEEPPGQTLAQDESFQTGLVIFESDLASAVLRDHVAGYSTTSRDLIHDLVPF